MKESGTLKYSFSWILLASIYIYIYFCIEGIKYTAMDVEFSVNQAASQDVPATTQSYVNYCGIRTEGWMVLGRS